MPDWIDYRPNFIPKIRDDDKTPAKRCSDYDDECDDVIDPIMCWVGNVTTTKNGVDLTCEKSDGYCPLMFKET